MKTDGHAMRRRFLQMRALSIVEGVLGCNRSDAVVRQLGVVWVPTKKGHSARRVLTTARGCKDGDIKGLLKISKDILQGDEGAVLGSFGSRRRRPRSESGRVFKQSCLCYAGQMVFVMVKVRKKK